MTNLQHTTAAQNGGADGSPAHRADTAALQADIERQRAALAATVRGLHERLDVKARTRERAQDIRQRPQVLAAGAGVLLAVVGLVVWRKRKETT